ncbi:sensor histidine kinase [Sphingomonas sp. AX6]|uniref:sensor histidine kinase n=1 Tax=Sphingomonas sp. AX6 TaxID=2653171 RepID=UPI0012F184C9|nr:ATP-binding protein [Sphingomonas sp. AX6]VXC96497.1 PAS domain-containing sensor histidine kinase [Sphingomonas sp. AX6]
MTVAEAPPREAEVPTRRRFTVTRTVEFAVFAAFASVLIATYFILADAEAGERLLTPPLVALLLVSNLIPAVALMVLLGRRIAHRRAADSPIGGGGKLHVRLVAIFSVLASVPTLLLAVFASLLFQYGVEFWYSDRARGMLENAVAQVRDNYARELDRIVRQAPPMREDLLFYLQSANIEDKQFVNGLVFQLYQRELSEAAILRMTDQGEFQTLAIVNPYDRELDGILTPQRFAAARQSASAVPISEPDRIGVLVRFDDSDNTFLYAARVFEDDLGIQIRRGEEIIADYRALRERSQRLQIQFNAALLILSIMIVGLAVFVALAVADRLVRPVSELVGAARRVADGDLTARVTTPKSQDEIGTLANAFNTMTDQLQHQTNALVSANSQIESRRALIEAVVEGVTAGVVSIAGDRSIRLINSSALAMLKAGEGQALDRPLAEIAPELDHLLDSDSREAVVQLTAGGDARTLAVKIAADGDGRILTFDDITQQLLDQRRAAWSDVARRIAHEIKNPLTPIQLAAERLQRRYGKQIASDDGTFARLTETIVRQVGDLRRMVDEFSSFARMPKPVFREESVIDLARQSLFLHEVAHPAIRFSIDHGNVSPSLVCDRRQIGQALTNIVKNAVEAVEAKEFDESEGEISMTLREAADDQLIIEIADNGVGLPIERDRIVEPYMTTRARGTGLGLAIVKKIVDEHFGTINFADRPGGGTLVTLCFDAHLLANMSGAGEDEGGAGEARPAMLTRNSNG